jgi:hypothetical protein
MQIEASRRRSFGDALKDFAEVLRACCAGAPGRTALELVRIPAGVTEVSARSRRLVRQARISPW